MKTSRWVKYDRKSKLWIQSNKRIYVYWFKFLQHAEKDPNRNVDWSVYDGWGGRDVVLNTKFDVWWRKRWKDLFGIPNEGDIPKFPLTTNRPKENGLRYSLMVYENRDMSSPLVMYHFVAEFLALAVSCLVTDEAGCDCTV